ncbi:PREDICTED: neural cell adhesion molecule L1-like protein isoform X2 [Poecilia mexicana]|uniref:neural cell adhesion molecule L1-like protein isoform X2 n=1 Tax=Poecilia mexicana TaxID=48701 RepID=UPI00072E960F|nr:PREDICTED: neural cell adhesion molecule L1-like protein isoform X2 [Poecilia mexicana]
MRSQRSSGLAGRLTLLVVTCLHAFHTTTAIDIPLEVEQLPTITDQAPSSLIAFPFDESFAMTCEAKGNPEPKFQWKKNGEDFDPYLDPRLMKEENSGTFVIPNNGNLTEYQGTYCCYASNKLGTAISKEIEFIVPNVPKFPKEKLDPVEVEEGQPFILKCDPPTGIPPLQIYWMTINLQHIEQDERVSTGLNGDLYFSHAVEKDSRRDYCCFAAFPRIRTIVQKTAMSVNVKTRGGDRSESANAILERKPSLLTPSGGSSENQLVKGEDLELECIPEGIPTPQVEWIKIGDQLPVKAKLENHRKLLIVPRAQQEDSGRYMCRANNSLGEAVHYFTVTVEGPPEWESEPQSQLSMIGSHVHIKCSARGVPEPTITWRVNGQLLQDSPVANRKMLSDTIFLQNAKASDSAVYQCEASNRHGTLLSNANIMIMNLQPMILTNNGEDYSGVEGKGVMMHCKVFSSPPSAITWSRDDSSESVAGPRFTLHDNGSLEIHSAEKGDAGQYTCLAKNTEGSSAIDAMLYIKDPTRIVVAPKDLQILKGSAAQLSCLAEYDKSFSNDFELLWEKDNIQIALNYTVNPRYIMEDGYLNISDVSHGDQGVYSCVAKTPLDRDTASAFLMVLDVPVAPENLVLSEYKSKSVKLEWIPGDDHNSSPTEFIIEFEENKWEPGNWKVLLRVPGNHNSAVLRLHGHVEYRFRVYAISAIGAGPPSEPTERYKTPPSAPDKNPENIKIEGHLPHEMNINWEPLLPIEHNGPGLEYKVSYRRQDGQEEWTEHTVKRHSFVVRNTPTFVPYEVKIQARNNQGWGPEPRIVSGYSGEDFPSAAPDDVAVEVMNSSAVRVTWTPVHKDKLHGHLGGYRINWWRLRSLVDSKKSHGDKQSLVFPGDRTHATVPGLTPFSEYSLIVMTFNGRGNGPGSHPFNFRTPEGVPEKNPVLRVTNVKRNSVSLAWAPPLEPNGILTGYLLEYQLINDTEEVGPLQAVNISNPNTTKWILHELEPLTKYKLYLRSCTAVGCGPVVSEESTTALETTSSLAPTVGIRKSLSTPTTPRSHVTKPTHPNIGLASVHGGISTQGWFIGLMSAIALLTLIVLIACFVNRNKGGKYSVKEKEDLHPDVESQGMNDDTFCEYSDNDEKPLKGSQHSLIREIKVADSGDSLVDYGDEDVQFNEDGSFIGEYGSCKEKRVSAEVKTSTQIPA